VLGTDCTQEAHQERLAADILVVETTGSADTGGVEKTVVVGIDLVVSILVAEGKAAGKLAWVGHTVLVRKSHSSHLVRLRKQQLEEGGRGNRSVHH
jgi:hypothetical protein